MSEHMVMAGFVVWLIAAGLYITDTLLRIITHTGDDR